MDRWSGRIAVVTGSSSGIGAAITKDLVKSGMIVIGLARRVERIEQLKQDLPEATRNRLYARKCDVSQDNDVIDTFKWIEEKFERIDVLINNAGLAEPQLLISEGNEQLLKNIIHINLWGTILCTKKAAELMKRRDINDGHFININSIAGHNIPVVPVSSRSLNVYSSTKYGITALTEVLCQEFNLIGTKIKVTSISPGVVLTDIGGGIEKNPLLQNNITLNPEDISNAVLYVLGTPPHVQIHELIIKPLGEKF